MIAAAAEEFYEKGFAKASLSKILKNANISKGSFYYTFDNKEDLLFQILLYFLGLKISMLEKVIEECDDDFFTSIFKITQAGFEFAALYPSGELLFQVMLKHYDEFNKVALEKLYSENPNLTRNLLNELIVSEFQKGGFHSELSLEFVLTFINNTFANSFNYIKSVPREDVEAEYLKFIGVLKRGLQSERRNYE